MRSAVITLTLLAATMAGCGNGAAVLPDAPVDRAAMCGVVAATRARAAASDLKAPLDLAQQAMILRPALLHAVADGSYDASAAAAVVDRMPAMGEGLNPERVDALAPQCATAFPDAPAKVVLPKDPLDAALGCEALGGFMARALESRADDHGRDLIRLAAMDRVLDDRVASLLAARGISKTASAEEAGNRAMAAIMQAGAPGAVLDACMGRYGAD